MSEKEKPKAVVVGGSIAGVACAHSLITAGWEVVVLEKSSSTTTTRSPTGAGLGLDPLAQRLVQSWLGRPDLLHNSTLPLTVDLVQPYQILSLYLSGFFVSNLVSNVIFPAPYGFLFVRTEPSN